jgi:hypothetical protein
MFELSSLVSLYDGLARTLTGAPAPA